MDDQNIAQTLCLSVISDVADFEALEAEWTALFDTAAKPYSFCQSFHWLRRWAKYYLDDRNELMIVVGRHQGRIVIIWPLVRRRTIGLKLLCWMGYPAYAYGDALVEPGPAAQQFLQQSWRFIASFEVDIVALQRVTASAAVSELIQTLKAKPSATFEAPFADFRTTDDFDARSSGKTRANRRKQLRELEKLGAVQFEYSDGGERLSELIRQGLAIKRRWAAARDLYSYYLSDPSFERFLLELAANPDPRGKVFAAALSLNDVVVGVTINFRCLDVMFGMIIAVDDDYRQWHIGELLLNYDLNKSFDSNCRAYEFSFPNSSFKMRFADSVEEVHDWSFALSRRGQIWQFARPRVRELFWRLPLPVRRVLGSAAGNV